MGISAEHKSEIVILPQSDKDTLCVSFHGILSKTEFQEHFYGPFRKIVNQNGEYNLLIHYAGDFEGWEKDAAEMSFQSIIDYGPSARKLAYVNPPDSKLLQVKMARPLFGGEIRFFKEEELDEALEWVKA